SPGQILVTTPQVAIGEGKQNYLLVSIYIHGETIFARTVVRAHKDSHVSLFDSFKSDMSEVGLCTKPLGGGMMNVDHSARTIKLKGACGTFGPADHRRARRIIKSFKKYENYTVTVA
ncbi:hypothetical protein KR093_011496, partial [Drosophila rubida]